jgi:hypothetical protein
MNKNKLLNLLVCVAVSVLMAACGGGGGGTSAPADTTGNGSTSTGSNGSGTTGATGTSGTGVTNTGTGGPNAGGVTTTAALDRQLVVYPAGLSHNIDPRVARLADGGFVVVWNRLQAGYIVDARDGVFAQRYDSQGNPSGAVVPIYPAGASGRFANTPHVAGLADGRYVVTFTSQLAAVQTTADHDYRYHVTVRDAQGVGDAMEIPLSQPSYSDVAALSDGSYAIVLDSRSTGDTAGGLAVQHYRALTALAAPVRLAAGFIGYGYPWTTSTPNGGFAIAWTDLIENTHADNANIHLRNFGADGAPSGAPVTVSLGLDNTLSNIASIAALKSGDIVFGVTNPGPSPRTSDGGVYAQFAIVHPDGSIAVARTNVDAETDLPPPACLTVPQPVPCFAPDQGVSAVAALDDGGFAIAWRSNALHRNDVLVRRYSAAGAALSGVVDAGSPGNIVRAALAPFGSNGLASVWQQSPSAEQLSSNNDFANTGISAHVWQPADQLK